tara:strand:+ start:327 stop:1304 length:978 start_codon:yes stop_codon:yes gene_type:complete
MGFIGKQPTPVPLTSSDITDGIVTTAKIADTAVSTAKIADDAVDNTKLDLTDDYSLTGAFTSQGIDDNANATAITIDSSENVGIGTSSPASALTVVGSTTNGSGIVDTLTLKNTGTTGNDGAKIQFTAGTSTSGAGIGSGGIAPNSANLNFFSGGNSQRMQIGADGDVGIGTGSTSSYFFYCINTPGRGVVSYFAATSGAGVYLSNGAGSWSTASDENIKENITELDKQKSYDNIKNIRAVNYNFKDVVKTNEDGKEVIHKDDIKRLGFIAQDWQKKYSEVIVKGPEDNLGLSYTETIPVLLSALQKAQEKIEALEARVSALESS